MQLDVDLAARRPPARVVGAVQLPRAAVPHDHVAAAVLAARDHAFELGVFDRVVLDVHREVARASGSSVTPFGTAQLTSTPSISSRKS